MKKNKNVVIFYLLSALNNFWFIASNWIFFWTRFMTYGQLGWVDALGFGLALLLEIPTGAIGDLLGKKRTILLGSLFSFVGVYIISFSSSLTPIFWGWLLAQAGFALYSGTGEAMLYDSLVEIKCQGEYDRIISKSSVIAEVTNVIATVTGGFIYAFNFRLPHILWGSGYLGAFFVTLWLKEPEVDTIKFSLKSYISQLAVGIKEIIRPGLRKYAVFAFFLSGAYFMYSWGFIRPAIAVSFGFNAKEMGVIFAGLTLLSAAIVGHLPNIRKRLNDLQGLSLLLIIMSLGFITSFFPIGKWGVLVMVVIAITGKLATPWISIIINHEIPSQFRATTLSTIALLTKTPYVLIAVIAGRIIQEGNIRQFSLGVGLVLFFGLIAGSILFKIRRRYALSQG